MPQAFEWVHELRPELAGAVEATGMTVFSLPLMVCRASLDPGDAAAQVRVLAADDAELPAVQAAIGLGFAAPGRRWARPVTPNGPRRPVRMVTTVSGG